MDLGGLFYAPLEEWSNSGWRTRQFIFHLTPGFGYALLNYGRTNDAAGYPNYWGPTDRWRYEYAADPRYARAHISLEAGVDWFANATVQLPLLRLGAAIAEEDVLAVVDDVHLIRAQSIFGDINVFKDLLISQANDHIAKCRGGELTVFDFATVRIGTYEKQRVDEYMAQDGTTWGMGLKSSGLLKLISVWDEIYTGDPQYDWIVKHIDLQWSYSEFKPHVVDPSLWLNYYRRPAKYQQFNLGINL
jgi:hypothetical protein